MVVDDTRFKSFVSFRRMITNELFLMQLQQNGNALMNQNDTKKKCFTGQVENMFDSSDKFSTEGWR